MKLSILMPALNEEKNINSAMSMCFKAMDAFKIDGEIIVINDGSTDGTEGIVRDYMKKESRLRMVVHETPQGIGSSFWRGVDESRSDAVVFIPSDNENDPYEILRYYGLLEHVDIVTPFLYNKNDRNRFRNVLSFLYRGIINMTFMVNFNYTNGTILYRKSILDQLPHRSFSFFFQTDILIRTVKSGYLFCETPYRINIREHGVSKAVTFPSLMMVAKGYLRLVRDFYLRPSGTQRLPLTKDSLSAKRWQESMS